MFEVQPRPQRSLAYALPRRCNHFPSAGATNVELKGGPSVSHDEVGKLLSESYCSDNVVHPLGRDTILVQAGLAAVDTKLAGRGHEHVTNFRLLLHYLLKLMENRIRTGAGRMVSLGSRDISNKMPLIWPKSLESQVEPRPRQAHPRLLNPSGSADGRLSVYLAGPIGFVCGRPITVTLHMMTEI